MPLSGEPSQEPDGAGPGSVVKASPLVGFGARWGQ